MIKFLKRKNRQISESTTPSNKANKEQNDQGFFTRLKQGLSKTRENLGSNIGTLLLGKKVIDNNILQKIETYLLMADVGVETTEKLIASISEKVKRKQLNDGDAVLDCLKAELIQKATEIASPLSIDNCHKPFVILMTGINGAGKTTTIGKLSKQLQAQNKKVMLAAGDTFRAAAIEQLQVWGERNEVPVIAQKAGTDSAAVIFDAMQSAQSKQYDVLIADTAGRLHTQKHLMSELEKIVRVIRKSDLSAPHETLLVLDASIGQNALQQALQFNQSIKITGLVITKLDGTAKGGLIFAIADKLKIPIRFIGVGEKIDDLKPFNPKEFVEALFEK